MKKILTFLLFVASLLTMTGCIEGYNFNYEIVGNGEVAGSSPGEYKKNATINLEAKPSENNVFDGYYEGDSLVEDNSKYSFSITKDTSLKVVFKENITYTFNYSIEGIGTVTAPSKGSYAKDYEITLKATPANGNEFVGFYNGSELITTELTYTFKLTKDTNIIVKFKATGPVEDNPNGGTYTNQDYEHAFVKDDFNKNGGSVSINGITWKYDSFTYLGQDTSDNQKGVQIGSAGNPQTNGWTISTTFSEKVIITDYSIGLSCASGGNFTYNLNFGNYEKEETLTNTSVKYFEETNLNVETNTFSLTLTAKEKAMYLKSISLNVKVPEGSDINLSGDSSSSDPEQPEKDDIPNPNYTLISVDDYYQDLNFDLEGEALIEELRTLISEMTKISYGDARYILQYTDENPNNPGFLYGLYDGDNLNSKWDKGATWNREHVWPCAQMELYGDARPDNNTKSHATDLHNLRASCPTVNGMHSNKLYDLTNTSNTMFPNVTGLGGNHQCKGDFRGDVARICFYMFVRYEGLKLTSDLSNVDNKTMGKLELLLEWNEADPVDSFEKQRNNRIYEYQGNRNPFIDYPELANQLF